MPYRVVLMLVLCSIPALLRATVLVPAEFREIVNGSEIIAYGRVTATTVEWSDNRKRVNTIVTMHVGTYLKGDRGETLVFRVPGGTIGRYMDVLVGAPHFAAGDEAVIFLNVRGSELPFVFGLNQGVFRVTLDGQTRRRMVAPPLLGHSATPERVVRGTEARRMLPLETFGAQVQTVLAESARSAR